MQFKGDLNKTHNMGVSEGRKTISSFGIPIIGGKISSTSGSPGTVIADVHCPDCPFVTLKRPQPISWKKEVNCTRKVKPCRL